MAASNMEVAAGFLAAPAAPDPEAHAVAKRRQFSAAYKRSVLVQADGLTESGAIGNVLAPQRQPFRTRHYLEVPLQPERHLRALDHRARGGVVGHLLKGHRGTQQVAGELEGLVPGQELVCDIQ